MTCPERTAPPGPATNSTAAPPRWTRTAPPDSRGLRLDRFWGRELADHGVSREKIKDWIKAGLALVDGRPCTRPNTALAGGERLELAGQVQDSPLVPVKAHLAILHQDADLAVIAKPAGLTTHPAPSVDEPTLVHTLLHHFPGIAGMDPDRPGIVHRLDKETSGLMVVALTEAARLVLTRDFAERRTAKAYLALVTGRPARPEGRIDAPIGRHPTAKTRMAVTPKGGREARSEYRVLWTAPGDLASLVLVRIHTGRTHQIRVHLSHLGHPLLGDPAYGFSPGAWTGPAAPRVMLHSFFLRVDHPAHGRPLSFVLPPPGDFTDLLAALNRRPLHLAVTGAPGSGKSSLARALADLGLPAFSADAEVARLYTRGGDGHRMLTARFGPDLDAPDGSGLDRARLTALMRGSQTLRREVMDLVHPMVAHGLEAFHREHRSEDLTVAEIPLLLEAGPGFREAFDLTVAAFCPDRERHARLAARGVAPDLPALLDSWQWPQADKVRACHLVVDNSGPPEALAAKAQAVVRIARDIQDRQRERFRMDLEALWGRLGRELAGDKGETATP